MVLILKVKKIGPTNMLTDSKPTDRLSYEMQDYGISGLQCLHQHSQSSHSQSSFDIFQFNLLKPSGFFAYHQV
jgi:hypothetical protein